MTTTRTGVAATRVQDIMRENVITIPATATLTEAARTLWQHDIGGAPVVDAAGRVVGVVSMRDLLAPGVARPELPSVAEAVTTGPEAGGVARVQDVMTRSRYSVRPETTIPELARFLLATDTHRALVMEGDRLVGIVTSSDVLRALAVLA